MPIRLTRLALILLAALAGCAHADATGDTAPAPASTSPAAPAAIATPPAVSTAPVDFMARGRQLAALFWSSDGKAWHAQLDPAVQGQVSVDQIQEANTGLKAKLGGEKSMVSEQMATFHGAPMYQRTFICTTVPDPLDFNIVLDPQGMILAFTVRPHGASVVPGQ